MYPILVFQFNDIRYYILSVIWWFHFWRVTYLFQFIYNASRFALNIKIRTIVSLSTTFFSFSRSWLFSSLHLCPNMSFDQSLDQALWKNQNLNFLADRWLSTISSSMSFEFGSFWIDSFSLHDILRIVYLKIIFTSFFKLIRIDSSLVRSDVYCQSFHSWFTSRIIVVT